MIVLSFYHELSILFIHRDTYGEGTNLSVIHGFKASKYVETTSQLNLGSNLPAPSLSGALNILAHLCGYAVTPCTWVMILGSIILPTTYYSYLSWRLNAKEEKWKVDNLHSCILPRVDNPVIIPIPLTPPPRHYYYYSIHTISTSYNYSNNVWRSNGRFLSEGEGGFGFVLALR